MSRSGIAFFNVKALIVLFGTNFPSIMSMCTFLAQLTASSCRFNSFKVLASMPGTISILSS